MTMAIDRQWRGNTQGIKWVLLLLTTTGFVAWAIGLSFTTRLTQSTSVGSYSSPRYRYAIPSDAELFFYAAALPMATFLAGVIDLVLFFNNLLFPAVSIAWGIIQFGVYIYMLTAWGVCEYSPDTGGEMCPNFYVYNYTRRNSVYESAEWYGRLVTGSIIAVLALTQMSLAAKAVDLARREKKVKVTKEAA